MTIAIGCTTGGDAEPTTTPIRSANTELQRSLGVFPVTDDTVLWVTDTADILIAAADIEQSHPFTLAGQTVTRVGSAPGSDTGLAAVVSNDKSVAAIPVLTSGGSRGVALVNSDGYKMALYLYGDSMASISSIKFMPETGLTLMSLSDETGSRVVAINNYGLKQFDLPVSDALGTLRYSPDELRYMVIDRRPIEQELELVPFAEPGESTLFRPSESSEELDRLYRSLATAIIDWR